MKAEVGNPRLKREVSLHSGQGRFPRAHEGTWILSSRKGGGRFLKGSGFRLLSPRWQLSRGGRRCQWGSGGSLTLVGDRLAVRSCPSSCSGLGQHVSAVCPPLGLQPTPEELGLSRVRALCQQDPLCPRINTRRLPAVSPQSSLPACPNLLVRPRSPQADGCGQLRTVGTAGALRTSLTLSDRLLVATQLPRRTFPSAYC